MTRKQAWAVALAAVTVLWGWSFVAIHALTATVSANTFNYLRFAIAALAMAPFAWRQVLRLGMRQWLWSLGAGVALFLAFALQTAGIALTTPSNAGFITGSAVLFVPLLGFVLLRTVPTRAQLLGAGIALFGLGLLTLQQLQLHTGDLLVLGCALFAALHIVLLSLATERVSTAALVAVQLAVVALLSWLAAWGNGEPLGVNGAGQWWVIAVLGIGGTAVAYAVQTKAQAHIAPSNIGLIILLEPVSGGIFGYWLAGDPFTPSTLLGAVLVVAGVWVGESNLKRQPRAAPPAGVAPLSGPGGHRRRS